MRTPRTVLVVDDDPANRLLLSDILTASDFRVNCAASGAEALSLTPNLQPDFILLDVMLPDTDGYAVCTELRRHFPKPRTRIYLMSGLDKEDVQPRANAAGADSSLAKPLNLRELLALLQ